ncbi:hypothetical protein LCER1_G006000 [Lachnellula cervina]|uniref:BTB domain-containing protein n=1 Tax=Lachnellula cervina TaxID=1316786 RepID=A0A7D8YID1_9HELO|nr:hypothetical protein LCER1_G006000 [Lachnellula cervina]
MAPPSPIVFTAPGLGPDMSIEVFEQIFHVNSMVLKIHSEYFRNYLDSPDKAPAGSVSGAFRYEWVTQVDEDGMGWSLTAKEKFTGTDNKFFGKLFEVAEISSFTNLIRAVHTRPIDVKTPQALCRLTKLADFYRVLPVVSNALNGVFYESLPFSSSISESCVELLDAAFKLRNKTLFKECFIHVMGPWSKPRFHSLKAQELKDLAIRAQLQLNTKIMEIQLALAVMTTDPTTPQFGPNSPFGPQLSSEMANIINAYRNVVIKDGKLIVPYYYRVLETIRISPHVSLTKKLSGLLQPVLKSMLRLDRGGDRAGEGIYGDSFLCFDLTDEELPWDDKQTSW